MDNSRPFDVKQLQSYPDDFDIISVVSKVGGQTIAKGNIIYVTSVSDTTTGFPEGTTQDTIMTLTEDITLREGDDFDDEAYIIGRLQNYSSIFLANPPCFSSDAGYEVIVAGEPKDMTPLNTTNGSFVIMGFFQQIVLPIYNGEDLNTTVIIAYK